MEEDPFDSLLGLEDHYYNEGFALGNADGIRVGQIEGRIFGLEKGFEKYIEMGKLHGRALVWSSRLQHSKEKPGSKTQDDLTGATGTTESKNLNGETETPSEDARSMLPSIPENKRLEKHVRTLYALTEPESLSTENNEEAVADFDDRLKRAQSKAKIIEKLVGEETTGATTNMGDLAIDFTAR